MRRVLVAALVGAALLAACGKNSSNKASTTTEQKSTSTSVPAVGADDAPLTGLPADASVRNRPALVVKIDNYAAKSYPQSGIGSADIVVCEGVEGGITRLMAIFQSKDAPTIGPIRSARSTDLHIAEAIGKPLFAYSGTNGDFQSLIDRAPVVDLHPDKLPSAYHRDSTRVAPYNLFSATSLFYNAPAAKDATAAKPLFAFAAAGTTATGTPVTGTPVTSLNLHWQMPDRPTMTHVTWTWKGAASSRVQEGQATVDANGPAVSPRNIVVLFVDYPDSGERDRSNSIVPEAKLTGVGEAWVVRDGMLTKGTWTKPGDASPIGLKDGSGQTIDLLPGQTWVELPASGNATVA